MSKIVVSSSEELAKKHPILFCFLVGGGLIGVGTFLSFFIIGMIIGIPLILIGVFFILIGFLGAMGKLLGLSLGKLPENIAAKKFGLLFPKSWRSKELQEQD